MFCFTAAAHFNRMSDDLVRMVPRWVPWPRAVVYFTGVCEIAGAIGLLVPPLRRVAGIALIAFLIAVFPANVGADRKRLTIAGRRATPLLIRLPMQVLFIALVWWATQLS
jgi:uncharacterized membrane protein